MQIKIRIKSKLEDNIFGQYTAEYLGLVVQNQIKENKELQLNSDTIHVKGTSEVVDKIPSLDLRKGDTVTVDSSVVRREMEIETVYSVNSLFNLYANNPAKGVICVLTKML